ncbi:DUF932 domain-containing protein [Kitasatospora sp. NPDC004272]
MLLNEPIQLPGDDSLTLPFLAVTNRFGLAGGCTLRATAVRIVCGNTFRAAELEGERTGTAYSFIHKRNWREHLEEAREAIIGARREFKEYEELATELLGIHVTAKQRELFLREFIPMPPEGLVTDRVARNVDEARKAVRDILASPTTAPIAESAYGLVQAAGEYLIRWNGKQYPGNHEPLISVELFEKVQRVLSRSADKIQRYRTHHPLFQGLVTCSACQGLLAWSTRRATGTANARSRGPAAGSASSARRWSSSKPPVP